MTWRKKLRTCKDVLLGFGSSSEPLFFFFYMCTPTGWLPVIAEKLLHKGHAITNPFYQPGPECSVSSDSEMGREVYVRMWNVRHLSRENSEKRGEIKKETQCYKDRFGWWMQFTSCWILNKKKHIKRHFSIGLFKVSALMLHLTNPLQESCGHHIIRCSL